MELINAVIVGFAVYYVVCVVKYDPEKIEPVIPGEKRTKLILVEDDSINPSVNVYSAYSFSLFDYFRIGLYTHYVEKSYKVVDNTLWHCHKCLSFWVSIILTILIAPTIEYYVIMTLISAGVSTILSQLDS